MTDVTQDAVRKPLPPERRPPTMEEFLDAYARQPVEVANGEIILMNPPGAEHSDASHVLYDSIRDFLKVHPLGVVRMETAYILDADDRADWVIGSRVPDVSFISQEKVDAHRA